MKWFLLALGLAGLALVLVFLPSADPYDQLWRALQDPESHQATLWSLVSREDGAGWVARVELGKLLRRKGETEASIALLREALELYETAEARRELAQALEEAGKNSEALAEWTKLLPDPEAAAAVARLSQNKISAGKILVSGRAYSKALEVLAGEKSPEAAFGAAALFPVWAGPLKLWVNTSNILQLFPATPRPIWNTANFWSAPGIRKRRFLPIGPQVPLVFTGWDCFWKL
jgi:tetratricopeptide (TPR) repeat protein